MNNMQQITKQGREIESDSFSIIDQEIQRDHGGHQFNDAEWNVVRRAIHTSGDFEFAKLFRFGGQGAAAGVEAIRNGCNIISDVTMITAGLAKRRCETFGNQSYCFINDDEVIARAKASGSTRAIEAMRQARDLQLLDGAIIGIGNAPTALYEVLAMVAAKQIKPALIIGIPVGFVKALESKQALTEQDDVAYITSLGRKGGSPLIVSSLHALMVEAAK